MCLFTLYCLQLCCTLPPSHLLTSQSFSSVWIQEGFFLSTCGGSRLFLMAGSWGKAVQGRERGREISVLMIFCAGLGFFFLFFLLIRTKLIHRSSPRVPTLSLPLTPSLSPILPCSFAPWTNSVVSSCLLCMLYYRGNIWFRMCSVLCIAHTETTLQLHTCSAFTVCEYYAHC